MNELIFVSPGEARAERGFAPLATSPLARALQGARGIEDLSLLGKLEVRGAAVGWLESDLDVLRITPCDSRPVSSQRNVRPLRSGMPMARK